MKARSDGKISQLNTPYARQVSSEKIRNRQVHQRRCKRIIAVFLVVFLIFGIQIFQSKRTLTDINGNIQQAQSQLTKQKQKNQQLQQQIKMLHNPDYIQQVIRSKYNYSKKGETIYNLN
ncbi:septum formation initiator family protein [Limosilactobacillus sp. STM2_1]|uniref:Septum formation initiator family protein n=1 Tax=Limosilactobacillus rudii TaxID=2759755 RepID=A0A7W3ULB2_9LACO|nr:septum formation initiator family protein [Limosilactobacillus rudii]MBB1079613.1 septum formation initiator family protein [Limosilactobacillus rudii]MBB1097691.1 septum formation initiator family protein [Limosilactobacillus rudii]MCD7134800.1 septum formation initiator family protein [Limosilactobacillus rudii]